MWRDETPAAHVERTGSGGPSLEIQPWHFLHTHTGTHAARLLNDSCPGLYLQWKVGIGELEEEGEGAMTLNR